MSRRVAVGVFAFLAFFSLFPSFVLTEVAQASPSICPAPGWNPPYQGWYRGYFSNKAYPYCGDELFAVLNDGLPSWVDTKQEFIDFIYGMNTSTRGSGDAEANRNFTGTSYIIQTMRGSTDHGFPDDADLADWRARLDNPGITVSRGGYSAAVNSARMNVGSPRDAMSYYGDGVTYDSLLFWYNGAVVYVVKYACANPLGGFRGLPDPIDFDLVPSISGDPSTTDSGSSVNVNPAVKNNGSTASTGVHWELNRFVLNATEPIPGGNVTAGGTPTSPAGQYGHALTRLDFQDNRAFPTGPATAVGAGAKVLPDAQVGYRICYALSIEPLSQTNSNWRHSPPFCVTVSKKPKVQVLGGDLVVGRGSAYNPTRTSNVDTSVSHPASGLYYGSWAEYAIVPNGSLNYMGSGSSLAGGTSVNPNTAMCSLSYLTITNGGSPTCNPNGLGRYTHTLTIPDTAARFPISTLPPSPTPKLTAALVNLQSGDRQGVYTTDRTTLSVAGDGDIEPGRWVVINAPDTDVTISDDIRYASGDLTNISEIPQVVIIAKNILIADNVQNVDAWLIAVGTGDDGDVNTCGAGAVGPTTEPNAMQCGLQLTINGPISANHLYLRRTAGAGPGTASGNPAEVLNLRADAYIWASSYSTGTGRLPTVTTTELPPRF